MPVYSVEGKLGTGKTKFCVWRARSALREGRKVASNVELNLGAMGLSKPGAYVRIPDKPSAFDLESLGHGNPGSYDEDNNGILLLDELGTWLNARSFQDKGRAPLLDWLIHARKFGWDVYLIVQDSMMIDKQVRESLVEYKCKCMRFDKVRIPIIGGLLQDVGEVFGRRRWGYLPRMHSVAARVGEGASAVVAERWRYRGDDLHAAYDTRQVFTAHWPHGAFSSLSPDYFDLVPEKRGWLAKLAAMVGGHARQRAPARPKLPWVAEIMSLPPAARIKAWQMIGGGHPEQLRLHRLSRGFEQTSALISGNFP